MDGDQLPRPPLGLGIIGLGMVADTHGRALSELADRIAVRGVFSRDPGRRAGYAARFGWPEAQSAQALIADPTVGAVLLLTPPNARLDLVEQAAAHGKHVLMEKPIERDSAAALRIVALCEGAGTRLGIVFQHRFRAAARALKGVLAAGRLGALQSVEVRIPWWREQGYYDQPGRGTYARDGGGVLISQAIHTLDLMGWLVGLPTEVQAMAGTVAHRMEAEDFVGAGLRFPGGALGALMATTAAFPGGAESIAIGGALGAARLEGGRLRLAWRDGRVESVGEASGTGGGADPMAFPHDWHRDLIADFADAVREGREPAVSGRQGLAVHRLIDALARSSAERRAVALTEI
jgi:predicted dehydrogenase